MSWCICREQQVEAFRLALNDLRKREIDTDLIIVCGHKEFKVHKNILASSCIYFHNMLYGDFAESNKQRIEMTKIEADIMADILDFIYTLAHPKLTDKSFERIANTFRATHFLMMEHYSNYLWMEMKRRVQLDNCLILLDMASLYDMDNREILNFAATHFSGVLKNECFNEIDEKQLHSLISNTNRKTKMCGDKLVEIVLDWVKTDEEQRKKSLSYLLTAIDLRSLTADFKKKLISNERLIYADSDALVKLVEATCVVKDIDWTVDHGDYMSAFDMFFFGKFYTLICSTNEYSKADAMQMYRRGKKQEVVKLPFTIDEGVSCVRWQNYIAFVGGVKDKVKFSHFILYDPEKNTSYYESSLPYPVTDAQLCVVNHTLYVLSELKENDNVRHLIQYYDRTKVWKVIEMQEIESVLAIVSMNDMLHVLTCKKKGEYYLHYVNKQNELLLLHRLPFSLEMYDKYFITVVDNKLCFLIFDNKKPKSCITYDGCTWNTEITSLLCTCYYLENFCLVPCDSQKRIFIIERDVLDDFHIFDLLSPTWIPEFDLVRSYDLGPRSIDSNNTEKHEKKFTHVLIE